MNWIIEKIRINCVINYGSIYYLLKKPRTTWTQEDFILYRIQQLEGVKVMMYILLNDEQLDDLRSVMLSCFSPRASTHSPMMISLLAATPAISRCRTLLSPTNVTTASANFA